MNSFICSFPFLALFTSFQKILFPLKLSKSSFLSLHLLICFSYPFHSIITSHSFLHSYSVRDPPVHPFSSLLVLISSFHHLLSLFPYPNCITSHTSLPQPVIISCSHSYFTQPVSLFSIFYSFHYPLLVCCMK